MTRTEVNEKALKETSKNAEKAVNAGIAPEYSLVPDEEKIAWAMALVIHCDMCRFIVAFDECEREGIARLLWMADIVSKLYEAKRWYFEKGGLLLLTIAQRRDYGPGYVRQRLKEIKSKYLINRIEHFAGYRNKLGFHYDRNALDQLIAFGKEDADLFYELLKAFAQFSKEWAQLTSSLIEK